MNFDRILYTTSGRKAVITLNRPEKRNALDDVMIRELTAAFQQAARDPQIKIILLEAAGKAFCAGADLEYLERMASFDLEQNKTDSQQLAVLFRLIHELRKPVIAMVGGAALAGGCGLASVCDFIIADEGNATFGYTEVRIGFIPAIVLTFLIKRIGEGKARELVMRGNTIDARRAYEIGLVGELVPGTDLEAAAHRLADELITHNSLLAMGLCKELLSKMHGLNLPDTLEFAANMNAAARMTPDCKQGVGAFLRKERINW
jgi:methylglutaconyl-CoA hydratase